MPRSSEAFSEPDYQGLTRDMRKLALRLVQDDATADDVVQSAWLAAFQEPGGRVRDWGAWMNRVVRNLAGLFQRHSVRRSDVETLWAENESDSEEAPDLEQATLRLLRETTEAMREPYRSVLWIHFFEGATIAQTASRLGRPIETVRSQVRRGLAELRTDLDRKHGGSRSAWALALLSIQSEPLPNKPPASRSMLRSRVFALTFVGAAMILLGAVAFVLRARAVSEDELASSELNAKELQETSSVSAQREMVAVTSGERVELVSIDLARHIEVRVRLEGGQFARKLEAKVWGERDDQAQTFSNSGVGSLEIDVPEGLVIRSAGLSGKEPGVHLIARAEGQAWSKRYTVRFAEGGRVLEVPARGPGQDLVGRVLDSIGRPVEGAEISAAQEQYSSGRTPEGDLVVERSLRTRSDKQGQFVLAGLPRRTHRLILRAKGTLPLRETLQSEGARLEQLFVLSPGATLRGQLRFADGTPASHARVWQDQYVRNGEPELPETRANELGEYELSGLEPGLCRVFASTQTESHWATTVLRLAGDQSHLNWNPRLESQPGFDVRVIEDHDSSPVEGATVMVSSIGRPLWVAQLASGGDGSCHSNFLPGGPVSIWIQRRVGEPGAFSKSHVKPSESEFVARLVSSTASAKLSGALTKPGGGMLPPSLVMGASDLAFFESELDPLTGAFQSSGLPPASYELWAVIEGYGAQTLGRFALKGEDLDVGQLVCGSRHFVKLDWGERVPSTETPWVLQVTGPADRTGGKLVQVLERPVEQLELLEGLYSLHPASLSYPVGVLFRVREQPQGGSAELNIVAVVLPGK